uniref:DNK domain-containing protein n=1 Tax=Caenorhabditis tropicalis TaxID=1561998 RepID=A0A1I7UN24_9PELO
MSFKSGYFVGIFGGIGSRKRLLAENLSRHLRDPRIQIFSQDSAHRLDYRIFLDRPYDQLLENYILGLPPKKLVDKEKLKKELEAFRRFHIEKVMPQKTLADVWYPGDVENKEKVHQLALGILKKRMEFDEDENVRIYLEANGRPQISHPGKINSEFLFK